MEFNSPNNQSTAPKENLAIIKPVDNMYWKPQQVGDFIEGVWIDDKNGVDQQNQVIRQPVLSVSPGVNKILPNHKILRDTFYDEESRLVKGGVYRIVCSKINLKSDGVNVAGYEYEVYSVQK